MNGKFGTGNSWKIFDMSKEKEGKEKLTATTGDTINNCQKIFCVSEREREQATYTNVYICVSVCVSQCEWVCKAVSESENCN